MNKKIAIFTLILFFNLCFLTQIVFAEETLQCRTEGMGKMGFYDAVKFSLENNNDIRALRKNLSATERDIGIERSLLMPKVTFIEGFTSTNNPTDALSLKLNQARANAGDLTLGTLNNPGTVTNFLTSGILAQPIYDRKSMMAIRLAKKEYSANGYAYLRRQEELVEQVAQAYLAVSTDEDYIKVAELALKDAKRHLKTAEDRQKNNSVTSSDILRVKTAVDEKEQKLNSAQRDLKVAKRKLGLLLGLEEAVEISSTVPEIKLQDLDYYRDFAVYRNDIKATEIRVQKAKTKIQSAQADWYPTLNALASYSAYNSSYPFGAQGSNYTAGAIFRWELFDGNKRKYEILKAKDKEAEIKEYLEGLKKTVDFNVYEYYQNVEEHQKNLEFAIAAQKSAEEDTKIIEKRWQDGLVPIVELSDAQAHLNDARYNVIISQFGLTEDLINLIYESGIICQELSPK